MALSAVKYAFISLEMQFSISYFILISFCIGNLRTDFYCGEGNVMGRLGPYITVISLYYFSICVAIYSWLLLCLLLSSGLLGFGTSVAVLPSKKAKSH